MLLDFRRNLGKFNRKNYIYKHLPEFIPASRHNSIVRHYLKGVQEGISFDLYSGNSFIIGQLDIVRYVEKTSWYESYIVNLLIYNLDDQTNTSYFEIKFSPRDVELGLVKRKEIEMIEVYNQFIYDIFVNFVYNVIEDYPKYLATIDEKSDRFLENKKKAEEELYRIWEETLEWCK